MRRFPWPDAHLLSQNSCFSTLPLHRPVQDRYTAHVLAKTHHRSLAATLVAAMAVVLSSLALTPAHNLRTERAAFASGLVSASGQLLSWATHDEGDFADSTKSAHFFPGFLAEVPHRLSDGRAVWLVVESATAQLTVLATNMQRGPPAGL